MNCVSVLSGILVFFWVQETQHNILPDWSCVRPSFGDDANDLAKTITPTMDERTKLRKNGGYRRD